MLSGMLARGMQPVFFVHACDVLPIVERFVKGMDYPAFDDFDVEDISFVNRSFVRRLPSFIRVKYDGIYSDPAVTDRFDFDFSLIDIRICPIKSFHNGIITGKQLFAQVPSYAKERKC